MWLPIAVIVTGTLVSRAAMHTGRTAPYDVLARLQTPKTLRSSEGRKRCVEAMGNALASVNVEYLREHPSTPSLYRSGVYYCDNYRGAADVWRDIPTTLDAGCGNCTALTAWRLAELWNSGQHDAEAHVIEQILPNGNTVFHMLVRFAGSQREEDPSAMLGMPL